MPSRARHRLAALLVMGLGVTGLTATSQKATAATPPTAAAALDQLPIREEAPMAGYSWSRFGSPWTDSVTMYGGHNGCDTRNDILRRDLSSIRLATGGCIVTSGVLVSDPYTARRIAFRQGPGVVASVQINHVVSLGDAWRKGAQGWSLAKRTQFANDPLNLLATGTATNIAKGDKDAASWLPRAAYQCPFVARQISIKRKYGLWIALDEADAMSTVLLNCPGQVLPSSASTVVPGKGRATHGTPKPAPRPKPKPSPKPRPKPAPRPKPKPKTRPKPSHVYYSSCAQARAAGATPLRRGQPGYRSGLDRDGDGVACERG